MEWDILLDGVSIKEFVNSFTVEHSMDAFCGQLTMDMASLSPFASRQWHIIPAEPDCQVRVKPASTWINLGTFFIEKPVFQTKPDSSVMQGVWGRSIQAKTSAPFASKLNKSWETDMMLNSIISDIYAFCGLVWDDAYNEIGDFLIYAGTFVANDVYPIDALSSIAMLCGGFFVGESDGTLRLKQINFYPVSGDSVLTLEDTDISSANQTVDFPDFGNRVKVFSSGSASGYSINWMLNKVCLPNDESYIKIAYVRVTDSEGAPINNTVVDFSVEDTGVAMVQATSTLTSTLYNYSETIRASSFTKINLSFTPSEVTAIYPMYNPAINLLSQIVSMDDTTLLLGTQLDYCDAMVRVLYNIEGVASVNIYGRDGISGDTILTASVQGEKDSVEVFTNNGCSCPVTLSILANPTSLDAGEISVLLIVAETDGINLSGSTVNTQIITGMNYGALLYASQILGPAAIVNEIQTVYEEVRGQKKVKTRYKIDNDSDISVYLFTRDENQVIIETGSDLFISFENENEIILSGSNIASGTEVSIDYYCQSGVVNTFSSAASLGASSATAEIQANMPGQTEEPLIATVSINIRDKAFDNTLDTDDGTEYSSSNTPTAPKSRTGLQEFQGRWCGNQLSNHYGTFVQWTDLWGILETSIGVMFDGYNPKAYIRHDALMADFGDNKCAYSVTRWPIYFQIWSSTSGYKYIPAACFLYDPDSED